MEKNCLQEIMIRNHKLPNFTLKYFKSNQEEQSSNLESVRSPKINSLFTKIQHQVEVKTIQQPTISYHQSKIREKLRRLNQTPQSTLVTQDSKDSFNIWNDDKILEGNIFDNYSYRHRSFGQVQQVPLKQEQIAQNLMALLGMKHKMKNIGNVPFFVSPKKEAQQYFLLQQKGWKLNKKKIINSHSSQNSLKFIEPTKTHIQDISLKTLDNLRKINSPDILKMKFKKIIQK